MIKRFTKFTLLIILGLLTLTACEDEVEGPTAVVTEDAIYISGDRVRMLGRIITTRNINATDHGFYISETQDFNQPIIISLGERDSPGRFIGETTGLKITQNYFVKSFVDNVSGLVFGNVIEVKTLEPEAFSFSPDNGPPGTEVVLEGKNFASDTQVLFGDRPAEIVRIDFDSRILLRVPESGDTPVETVKVVIQGREFELDQKFNYTTGKFTLLSKFPESIQIANNVFFQANDRFYVGLGTDRGTTLNSKFWSYDFQTEQWADAGFTGTPLWLSFVGGTYFGGGSAIVTRAPYTLTRDFWKYEEGTGNFVRLPDIPFDTFESISFEAGDQLYVIGGGLGFNNEVQRYDKITQQWTRLADAPFSVFNSLFNFNYNGNHYIVGRMTREIHVFNTQTETWSVYGLYPGEVTNSQGFAVVIGDLLHIGMGGRSSQVWQLNLTTGVWKRKNDFKDRLAAFNVAYFEREGLIYFLRTGESQAFGDTEFWLYDPDGF